MSEQLAKEKVIQAYDPKRDGELQVGEILTYHVGAPGIGTLKYKVTFIDKIEGWVYGYLVEDNSRILEPWEVV